MPSSCAKNGMMFASSHAATAVAVLMQSHWVTSTRPPAPTTCGVRRTWIARLTSCEEMMYETQVATTLRPAPRPPSRRSLPLARVLVRTAPRMLQREAAVAVSPLRRDAVCGRTSTP